MGSFVRVALATVIIALVGRFESVHALPQRFAPDTTSEAEVGASQDSGGSSKAEPDDESRKAVCADLFRKLDVKASLVLSYLKIHMYNIGEAMAAEKKLAEELQRPFIIRSKDEIARLRHLIAKTKQELKISEARLKAAVEELKALEDEFLSTNSCSDFYGNEMVWRDKRSPNLEWLWSNFI